MVSDSLRLCVAIIQDKVNKKHLAYLRSLYTYYKMLKYWAYNLTCKIYIMKKTYLSLMFFVNSLICDCILLISSSLLRSSPASFCCIPILLSDSYKNEWTYIKLHDVETIFTLTGLFKERFWYIGLERKNLLNYSCK